MAHIVGSQAVNFHEGSRSEILADYLFTAWGTVTPVRRQDDYGMDLYCTLWDRMGLRAIVREYYTVQVKSGMEPWELKSRVIEEINPILRGWMNYFRIGHSSRCFSKIRDWVEMKIRRHLMRSRLRKGKGWKRWSSGWIYR